MLILQIKYLQWRQIVIAEKPVLESQAWLKSMVSISTDSAIKAVKKCYNLEFEPYAFPLYARLFSASGPSYMLSHHLENTAHLANPTDFSLSQLIAPRLPFPFFPCTYMLLHLSWL